MKYKVVPLETTEETVRAYDAGQCDVLTSDKSHLYGDRLSLGNPEDHEILDDDISRQPLGPAVRQDGDMQWLNIVKWVNFALLNAEYVKVSAATVEQAKQSPRVDVRRIAGVEGNFGAQLGLSPQWAVNLIKAVGNYGEMFDRNLGEKSLLGIPRGLNDLSDNGGIQYAPPIQ